MDKLKMQTPNLVDENVEKIGKIFPEVITEIEGEDGKLKRGIDFDLLKQKLSDILVEDENERYRLDWPGKKASLLKANTPITKTLRPVVEESVDFENTENLYIEGDNFEVLKILQESYLGKVKMIYIDPPYNRGSDLLYKDTFSITEQDYENEIGIYNEEGGKLFRNTDTNGRFHSDWLSMMYERLLISRDLLGNLGVILISIDDSEAANLKKICDEIFGENNMLGQLVWDLGSGTAAGHFTRAHEYILVYAKDKEALNNFSYSGEDSIISERAVKKITKANPASNITFKPGIECEVDEATFEGTYGNSEKIEVLDNKKMIIKNGRLQNEVTIRAGWAMRDQILSWLSGKETYDSKGQKVIKFFFSKNGVLQYEKQRGFINPQTVLRKIASTKKGTSELSELFGVSVLEFPKPTTLLNWLISTITDKCDIVLDYFSGSATTAHSVLKLNAEEIGRRKFLMIQLPEKTGENSDAYKAGYKTISDIGKERIRRAGKKIKEEYLQKYQGELDKVNKELEQESLEGNEDLEAQKAELEAKIEHVKNLDTGFRVYKTDSSNMKDVYYHPTELTQEQLSAIESNIKEDRTPEDLLTQVILDLGLELSLPIEKKEILGNNVFFVQQNALVACFDEKINFDIVDKIAEIKPFKVVFRDSSFADDKDRINVEERFKRLSQETVVSVI